MKEKEVVRSIDWLIMWIVIFLLLIGLVNVYSVNFMDSSELLFDMSTNIGRQLFWVGICVIVFWIIMIVEVRFFINFSYGVYLITILLLVATILIGKEINGSRSWIILGSFRMQPSELAKFGTALALARFLDTSDINLTKTKHAFVAFLIIGIPIILVVLQRDYGSAIVFFSFVFVLFRQGLSGLFIYLPIVAIILFVLALLINIYWLIALVAFIAICFSFFAPNRRKAITVSIIGFVTIALFFLSVNFLFNKVLLPHQQARINVLLGKEIDLKGAGYNVHQSLIAIGSGGLSGKGFLKGTQTKFNFIPEQTTDFIFCTIGEEYGLMGSTVLLLLFTGLLLRIIFVSEKQKFRFTRIFGYGVVSIIFIHFLINVGMTLGIFPVIGIPLPFVSYGGSSLLGFTLLISIFLKLELEFRHYYK